MRKTSLFLAAILSVSAASVFSSCDDDVSNIGNSLVQGEVEIFVDSARHAVNAITVYDPSFDARTQSLLLGKLDADQYGSLECSFVSRLMPAYSLAIPDSIDINRVDSLRIVFNATRGNLTGDSLLPQRLSVYQLSRQLPDNITSSFNPDGYYDPRQPLTSVNYTMSRLGASDSSFYKGTDLRISATLPAEWGRRIYQAYRNDATPFQWPSSFAAKFPGIFVKQTFGSGCLANFNSVSFIIYYYKLALANKVVDDKNVTIQVHKADSAVVFATAPEVLSSNVVKYSPSAYIDQLVARGKSVVTTPGGYVTRFDFPLQDILDKYFSKNYNLSVIGNLNFEVPATAVPGEHKLGMPPYMLMIKTSKVKEFFASNSLPDNKESFWASYNSEKGCYRFTSMRQYLIDAIAKGQTADPDDTDYTLVPVNMTIETYTNYSNQTVTKVLACTPYMGAPTMAMLDMKNTLICLTFTNQVFK